MEMSEFFRRKIEIANGLLASYKEVEESLTFMIENPQNGQTPIELKYKQSKQKVERFEIQAAIVSQEFNIDELVKKREGYNQLIEQLGERMVDEWEPTLIAIKKKMMKRTDQKIGVQDLAQALARADQPFVSEPEKIEFFQSLLNFAK